MSEPVNYAGFAPSGLILKNGTFSAVVSHIYLKIKIILPDS
jgi:hypothetical protein